MPFVFEDKRYENQPLKQEDFVRKYVKKSDTSYRFLRFLLSPVATVLYHPVYIGKDNIPESGSVILCSNHRHAADAAFLSMSTKRTVHYLAKKELHTSPLGFFYRMAQTIPVDRSRKDSNPSAAAHEVLKKNEVIGIFPEGTRNKHAEELLPFHYGAVRMAQKSGASIVPIAICGEIKPFTGNVRVHIGKPYTIGEEADLNEENRKLREVIAQLYERGKL